MEKAAGRTLPESLMALNLLSQPFLGLAALLLLSSEKYSHLYSYTVLPPSPLPAELGLCYCGPGGPIPCIGFFYANTLSLLFLDNCLRKF